ncbi:MAG TPA: sigma-70 family RNA polymerase sigma factor [Armatimonadota bacterium]|jgi:RNA polymerase sigma-70 factor (ECF subfamily)
MQQTSIANTDAELIERARGGDARAFDRLVQEHYVLAYNTAYRMLGNPDQAEDATVEGFARAYRSLDRFRGDSSFTTWLYRIVTNVCLDYLRAPAQATTSLDEGGGEDGGLAREVPDESSNPATSALQKRRQQAVHAALQRLSSEHRAVLVLYDLNGFSYEEVGTTLGIPVGTVKSRLNRARHALKQELQEQLELFE